jgi:hypothetical protein
MHLNKNIEFIMAETLKIKFCKIFVIIIILEVQLKVYSILAKNGQNVNPATFLSPAKSYMMSDNDFLFSDKFEMSTFNGYNPNG